MKHKMIIVAALSTACIQGMESNSWSMVVGDTKINVIKGFIGDAKNRVDEIVVGRNQQRKLKQYSFIDCKEVGLFFLSLVYIKKDRMMKVLPMMIHISQIH